MTGGFKNEAAFDHPGNAVVKPLTVGLNPWEAHELGGDNNTTHLNTVVINHLSFELFRPVPLHPPFDKDRDVIWRELFSGWVGCIRNQIWDGTEAVPPMKTSGNAQRKSGAG